MKIAAAVAAASLLCASNAFPQGRAVDWPSAQGDARRTGWERSDTRITKDNVKDFQLVLKRKFGDGVKTSQGLTPPVVIGLLISYRGFKELGFVAGSAGDLWSVDLDLNRVFWHKKFSALTGQSNACASAVTAVPALTPPTIFGAKPRRAAPASPGLPASPAGSNTNTALPARLGGTGFGAPRPVYILAGDGQLRQINTSDGSDQFPSLKFLPANAKASTLTLNNNVMYTTTSSACGSAADAIWALDMRAEEPQPVSFKLNGGTAGGLSGFAVGNDGTLYVQTRPFNGKPSEPGRPHPLLALNGGDLKQKGSFLPPTGPAKPVANDLNAPTPVVFEYKGRDVVISGGLDSRLYVLDSASIGSDDQKTPLSQTAPLSAGNGGVWGGLTTWEDADGTRWVAAPVWGPINPELKAPSSNGPVTNGAIVAFKIDEQNGAPALVPAWVSRDLRSPVPPVTTSGVIFALSTGGGSNPAVFYALDGSTGKEMFTSGTQVNAPAALTGMSLANGRIFFTTTDNTLYGFGVFMEI